MKAGASDITSSQLVGQKITHRKSFFSEQNIPIDFNSLQNILSGAIVSKVYVYGRLIKHCKSGAFPNAIAEHSPKKTLIPSHIGVNQY